MWMNVIGLTGLLSVCCLAGMVIYSEYKDCDPMCEGSVLSSDQVDINIHTSSPWIGKGVSATL